MVVKNSNQERLEGKEIVIEDIVLDTKRRRVVKYMGSNECGPMHIQIDGLGQGNGPTHMQIYEIDGSKNLKGAGSGHQVCLEL